MAIFKASGQVDFIVDDEDADWISAYRWYARVTRPNVKDKFYIFRANGNNGVLYLHRLVANPEPGLVVDHINGNTMDNRRANLRCVTHSVNIQNSRRRVGKNGFVGVNRHCNGFRAVIYVNKKQFHGKTRNDPVAAAADYDSLALRHYGPLAALNFEASRQVQAIQERGQ